MKNIFSVDKLNQFSALVQSAYRIAIISHNNPDGDAVGSSLALSLFIRAHFGKDKNCVRCFVPNHFPKFLNWVDPNNDVEIFGENCKEVSSFIASADLIIIADFNDTRRLERMSAALDMNISAPRILIDHHLEPVTYDLMFHTTDSSSTAYLVFNLIEALGGEITLDMARGIYLGMMTDTGNFSFGNLNAELYRAVATLVEVGVDTPAINRAVFNTQSEGRLRMVGYLLSSNMVVDHAQHSAYITLTIDEKNRFNHQIGDTEGVVNMPLTIQGINFAVILIQTTECIKLSLRSVGELDVNVIAREHFNGGGHRNAAGGKFFGPMDDAVAIVKNIIAALPTE